MESRLREALTQVYKRITGPGALSRHVGADPNLIARLAPRLRNELDRRIMTARDLIRFHREEAINRTLRRFAGWGTSIPPGGTSNEARASKKMEIKKALASLPFEERRVIIDQQQKLTAAFHSIIATEGGAIAGEWHSHWRAPGYDYRPDHKERDGKVYAIKGCSAHAAGLMNRGSGFTEDMSAPTQEPNCRCSMTYYYNLRQLPPSMLTIKGRAALLEVA